MISILMKNSKIPTNPKREYISEILIYANKVFEEKESNKPFIIEKKELKSLHLLSNFPNFILKDSFFYSSLKKPIKLQFIETNSVGKVYSSRAGSSNLDFKGLYLLVYINTNKDYGRTFIKKESVVDKIVDVFYRDDVDIKGFNEFNRKFHCISNDRSKFTNNFSLELSKALCKHVGEIYLEFNHNLCAITCLQPVNKLAKNKNVLLTVRNIAKFL